MENNFHLDSVKKQDSLFVVASKRLVKIFGLRDGDVKNSEVVRASGETVKSGRPKFFERVAKKLQGIRSAGSQSVYIFAPEEILGTLKLRMPKKIVEKIDSEFSGNYTAYRLASLLEKVALKRGAEAKAEAQMRVEKRTAALLNNIGNSVFPWEKQVF